jgi:hypothetical protein
MTIDSVVAMGFSKDAVGDVCVDVIERLNDKDTDLTNSLKLFKEHFGTCINNLPNDKYAGFLLMDGNSKKVERVLEALGDNTNIFFSGGSAGDALEFKHTFIHSNGKVYGDESAVIAIFEMNCRFSFMKLQSVRDMGKRVVATKVDVNERIIYELDYKPAAEVFSEMVGVSIDKINTEIENYHFALMIDGQPFLRALRCCNDGKTLEMACSVRQNMPLSLYKPENLVGDTKGKLAKMQEEHPNIIGMLIFNCAHRYLQALHAGQVEEYGKLFTDITTVGFNTFGEYYIGLLNNTATFVIFEE